LPSAAFIGELNGYRSVVESIAEVPTDKQ
jgi:hypothetical protein